MLAHIELSARPYWLSAVATRAALRVEDKSAAAQQPKDAHTAASNSVAVPTRTAAVASITAATFNCYAGRDSDAVAAITSSGQPQHRVPPNWLTWQGCRALHQLFCLHLMRPSTYGQSPRNCDVNTNSVHWNLVHT